MSDALHLIRHGVFFGLTLAPALIALGMAVRALAQRRSLECAPLQIPKVLRLVLLIALCGVLGQALFAILSATGALSVGAARIIGLAAATAAAGVLAARVVPYFCPWKGLVFGTLAAVPAAWVYQAGLPHGEMMARVGVAAVLALFLALAVTLPIPETVSERPKESADALFLPWLGAVGLGQRIRPPGGTICPTRVVLTAESRSWWRRGSSGRGRRRSTR